MTRAKRLYDRVDFFPLTRYEYDSRKKPKLKGLYTHPDHMQTIEDEVKVDSAQPERALGRRL